jgi:archaellum biogenesis ATPase FlaH
MPKSGYDLPVLKMEEFIKTVENLPAQEDIIEGILPKNEVGIICGEAWQGKSLEQQALACALGMGANYHGLKVKKCQCLYVTWEGASKGIANRLNLVSLKTTPLIEPLIKLAPAAMPINTQTGYDEFRKLLDEANKVAKVEVVLVDSFAYTIKGQTKEDMIINQWWSQLQKIISEFDITVIFSWEFTKQIIFDARLKQQTFTLDRLKTASTTAYKVNAVIAIGELKNQVKKQWISLGHKIVVMKAKDSPIFEPLSVSLSPCLLWEGQHWEYDNKQYMWRAVND